MSIFSTYTGKQVDFNTFSEDDVCLEDIAHHLSRIQRSCGSLPLKYSYTVGEHCISLAHYLKKAKVSTLAKKLILLHDASEAYMSDVPSPIKYMMPDYLEWEDKIQKVINKRFLGVDVTVDDSSLLKHLDKCIYLDEVKLFEPHNYAAELKKSLYTPLNCYIHHNNHPSTIKQCFLTLAKELGIK